MKSDVVGFCLEVDSMSTTQTATVGKYADLIRQRSARLVSKFANFLEFKMASNQFLITLGILACCLRRTFAQGLTTMNNNFLTAEVSMEVDDTTGSRCHICTAGK